MEQTLCPICFEIPDLPVSVNISHEKKCPFIQKNPVCLRCITQMISHHKYTFKMKCICNAHTIDTSNIFYMSYGDIDHFSDDFVEKKLWNTLYYKNKKCNSCGKKFKNIKQLYQHYKYFGNTCIPLNKNKIRLIIFISLLNILNQLFLYYYLNNCTIYLDDIFKRYCLDDCFDSICYNMYKHYKIIGIYFLVSYYLTINILIENLVNLFHETKIIFVNSKQMYNVMVLTYLLFIMILEIHNLNDLILFLVIKEIIEFSFRIKICLAFYQYSYK